MLDQIQLIAGADLDRALRFAAKLIEWSFALLVRTLFAILGVIKAVWMIALVVLLMISLLINVAAFSTGAVARFVSSSVEATIGIQTVATRFTAAESRATALSNELKNATSTVDVLKKDAKVSAANLEDERIAKRALSDEVSAERVAVSKLQGTVAGKELTIAKMSSDEAELQLDRDLAMKSGRQVTVDRKNMAEKDAVSAVTRRMRNRAEKWTFTDLGATFGQAIPWIGTAVVVVATAYDVKNTCDTMKDAHALELAFNPDDVDASDVERVCGVKVPTATEVWNYVENSPSAAWDSAASALSDLPQEMPTLPDFTWPSWPAMPDILWKFWQ